MSKPIHNQQDRSGTNHFKVGIAGLGVVGSAVAQSLQSGRYSQHLSLVEVCARDKNKLRDIDMSSLKWCDDPMQLATSSGVDIVVELMGGADEPALSFVEAALKSGKHVVTANKALLAEQGLHLAKIAERNGCTIAYEAAVAGGIPVIKSITEGLAANQIDRVYGILNGTCNYILTLMEQEGHSFEDCLKQAQELGYAEADPSFDIGGLDTAHKITLLTSLAFGVEPALDQVYLEGINSIMPLDIAAAKRMGYRIKLLGVTKRTTLGIEQRVNPAMVPVNSPIAQIGNVTNAVAIDTDLTQTIVLSGPGAGGSATASAVLADLLDIANGRIRPVFGRPLSSIVSQKRSRLQAHEGRYYVRLNILDKPGTFASIAGYMGKEGISLESIMQTSLDEVHDTKTTADMKKPVYRTAIMITDRTKEASVRKAVQAILAQGIVSNDVQVIRIENFENE